MSPGRPIAAALAALAVLAAPPDARADVPPTQQSLLLLRILAYDRNLKARAGDRATVVVTYAPGDAASEAARDAMIAAIEETAKKAAVAGLPIHVLSLPFTDAGVFSAKLSSARPAAVWVAPGLDGSAVAISGVTRKLSVLSTTGSEPAVRAGLSIGLVPKEGKPGIVVNLPATKAEGVDLDAALLRVAAEVIR